MSYHVYIAYPGFKETPIFLDAWLTAVRQCDDVVVEERKNRHGKSSYSVTLRGGDKRAWLHLDPYGLVVAQDPSRELVIAMFKLANTLGAEVYSERLKKYNSIDDWTSVHINTVSRAMRGVRDTECRGDLELRFGFCFC